MRSSWAIPKRLFDVAAALAGLIVLSPLMLVLAVLVRATTPGPALFIQERVGRNGRVFRCAKFRTMGAGAQAQGTVTTAADARVTPLGRFLRRWKLDELPQLWNVLAGRMSFVGPRPDVPGYADRLQGDDRRILELRPGITGPATLLFRDEERLLALAKNPQAFNDAVVYPEKVRLNREYLETGNFWRDLGYVLATVWPGLTRRLGWDLRLGLRYGEFSARLEREAVRY
ncbi:MAG TPA: sugar transferase [Kiritimatiellia bacterium]|nr:sugar transferase [Kiritimatiellia bacterium]